MNAGCPGQPTGISGTQAGVFQGVGLGSLWLEPSLVGAGGGGSSTLWGRASQGECKSRLRIKAFAAEHDSLGVGMRKKAKG